MPENPVRCKRVLDEQDIRINPNGLSLDVNRAKGKISDFDRNPIEVAVLLVESWVYGRCTHLWCACNRATFGLAGLLERFLHIIHEALKLMFTVDNKLSEKVTKTSWKYPRVFCGLTFAVSNASQKTTSH